MAAVAKNDPESDGGEFLNERDEEWHYDPHRQRVQQKSHDARQAQRQSSQFDEEEPLLDMTEVLPLRSKRTDRLQKKQQKKSKKNVTHSSVDSLLDLPSELVLQIINSLRPTDVVTLLTVSRSMHAYILDNSATIASSIINLRYPILAKCFPLPILISQVSLSAHPALLSPRHQQRLIIHKAPYQHIRRADPINTCSCMACVMAWNNLCVAVDLAHWQPHLDRREPIPMIARGSTPKWNTDLIAANAAIVDRAIRHPLWYARVLEAHLDTTTRTILRHARTTTIPKRKGEIRLHGALTKEVAPSKRLFHLSAADATAETDVFLARSGPPNFEFPFHRDNYYTLGAYLPNRRWDEGSWIYYGGELHERDVAWAVVVAEREARQVQVKEAGKSEMKMV